jgi:hypothetical protein
MKPLWWVGAGAALVATVPAIAAGERVRVTVDLTPAGLRQVTSPAEALGAGIDGAQQGDVDRLFAGHNIPSMRSAGLRPLTYRLRTELGIEAWHWGEEGSWSDPARSQGYWTGSDRQSKPVLTSWGYRLPRRGDTVDNANNADWSMLTDGDHETFWKSNPYLDPSYTGEAARPQWLTVNLGEHLAVDAIEIDWAEPYAVRYEVQYWSSMNEYDAQGRWVTFPQGAVSDGKGGRVRLSLGAAPDKVQWLRIRLDEGSRTAPPGATDPRDRMGYAVREVGFGRMEGGVFRDLTRHAPSHDKQTLTHVSSTDPWHRAQDRDPELEQPGFDRVFSSGLTNGLPLLIPVPVLFDTPENGAAMIRFLKSRGYPIRAVELGEEPDGQYADPRDYGALYLQGADAVRAIDPTLILGGPSLQSGFTETYMVPEVGRSWNKGFVDYLKRRGRMGDLQFLSFEYYPFDDICGDIPGKLRQQTRMLAEVMRRLRDEGGRPDFPLIISEYGFSAFSGRAMSEMPSALLMADIAGGFLTGGGQTAYMFGYPPNVPVNQHLECAGFGNMMTFTADPYGQAKDPMPIYHTARLLTGTWMQAGGRPHRVRAATVAGAGDSVTAYAVERPDGRLGILLVNRDPKQKFEIELDALRDAGGSPVPLAGVREITQYSSAQYQWVSDGLASHPSRNLPPARRVLKSGAVTLPASSVTVVLTR